MTAASIPQEDFGVGVEVTPSLQGVWVSGLRL